MLCILIFLLIWIVISIYISINNPDEIGESILVSGLLTVFILLIWMLVSMPISLTCDRDDITESVYNIEYNTNLDCYCYKRYNKPYSVITDEEHCLQELPSNVKIITSNENIVEHHVKPAKNKILSKIFLISDGNYDVLRVEDVKFLE